MTLRILTSTEARKHLADIISEVRYSNRPIAIGRHKKADVLLVKFPDQMNADVEEITNMNQYGGGFDFLEQEPELYSVSDLKKRYV